MNHYKTILQHLENHFEELMDHDNENDQGGWGRAGNMAAINDCLDEIRKMLEFMSTHGHGYQSAAEAYREWEADHIAIDVR